MIKICHVITSCMFQFPAFTLRENKRFPLLSSFSIQLFLKSFSCTWESASYGYTYYMPYSCLYFKIKLLMMMILLGCQGRALGMVQIQADDNQWFYRNWLMWIKLFRSKRGCSWVFFRSRVYCNILYCFKMRN